MDEATTVLRRLERIDALEKGRGAPGQLLDELRALVREAEAWARSEDDARATAAAARLGEKVSRGGEVVDADAA